MLIGRSEVSDLLRRAWPPVDPKAIGDVRDLANLTLEAVADPPAVEISC